MKNRLVIVKKAENLNDLIRFLRDLDANLKQISKNLYLDATSGTPITSTTKAAPKTINSSSAKPFISVRVIAIASRVSIVTRINPGLLHILIVGGRMPILQVEKDCSNNLGLSCYYDKADYIAINQNTSALLASKSQAGSIMSHFIALIHYNPPTIMEKSSSLS